MIEETNEGLPENWQELSHLEKDKWFARHWYRYLREGEYDGLRDGAPEDVKQAYEAFLKEEN